MESSQGWRKKPGRAGRNGCGESPRGHAVFNASAGPMRQALAPLDPLGPARFGKKRGGGFPEEARRQPKGLTKVRVVYLMADRAVSTESLAMNAAPHQSEPTPVGLIGVTAVVPVAVWSLVKALQSPWFRSVS